MPLIRAHPDAPNPHCLVPDYLGRSNLNRYAPKDRHPQRFEAARLARGMDGFYYALNMSTANRIPYEKVPHDQRPVEHAGQRKLILAEIELLTRCVETFGLKTRFTVVYAGSAPGNHLIELGAMFPQSDFVLYDPVTHDKRLRDAQTSGDTRWEVHDGTTPNERSRPNPGYFDDFAAETVARRLREQGRPFVFISDIRVVPRRTPEMSKKQHDEAQEKAIEGDMAAQRRWVMMMRPRFSLLKFRLPWADGKTLYLKGEILLQAYGRTSTTETRLFVDGDDVPSLQCPAAAASAENPCHRSPAGEPDDDVSTLLQGLDSPEHSMVEYDNRAYEEALACFNVYERGCMYENGFVGLPAGNGPDTCWDCTRAYGILDRYYRAVSRDPSPQFIYDELIRISKAVGRPLGVRGRCDSESSGESDDEQGGAASRRAQRKKGRQSWQPQSQGHRPAPARGAAQARGAASRPSIETLLKELGL
jgi:hypothetical protein